MPAVARQCGNCGRIVRPRGDATPRYCAICGERLRGGPVEACDGPVRAAVRTPGRAVASLVVGLVSLPTPLLGLPLGLLAVVLGSSAKDRIRRSGGRLGGEGLATAGITLGAISCILRVLFCLGIF